MIILILTYKARLSGATIILTTEETKEHEENLKELITIHALGSKTQDFRGSR